MHKEYGVLKPKWEVGITFSVSGNPKVFRFPHQRKYCMALGAEAHTGQVNVKFNRQTFACW